jgi:hypothetical protein
VFIDGREDSAGLAGDAATPLPLLLLEPIDTAGAGRLGIGGTVVVTVIGAGAGTAGAAGATAVTAGEAAGPPSLVDEDVFSKRRRSSRT